MSQTVPIISVVAGQAAIVIPTPTPEDTVVITPIGPGPKVWPLVVKATEPTAADYGESEIPMNAIWVKSPS
jgi:hypothetical protein